MARKLAIDNPGINSLLNKLIDLATDSAEYANTMYELGKEFGARILVNVEKSQKIALVSTVEDTDYLGRGIIEVLELAGRDVLLTVFWNKRFKPNKENNISVAPIIREFHEPGYKEASVLIIIKSIISNSCVVRTNLTKYIEEAAPTIIWVVAPVLLKGATENLEKEFDSAISAKFRYLYFAEDDVKTDQGIVIPGIGGDVYKRLGFAGQDDKNRYVPMLVKERRFKYS